MRWDRRRSEWGTESRLRPGWHEQVELDRYPGTWVAWVYIDFSHTYDGADVSAIPPGRYDLRTTLLHEFTHVLGVTSYATGFGTPLRSGGGYTWFNSYQYLGPGPEDPLFPNGKFDNTSSNLIGGRIWFRRPNAMEVYGGPVPVYSEAPFRMGRSLSHFEEGVPSVMSMAETEISVMREWTELDLAVLRDIGWNVRTAPEPEAGALLILAVAAGALRRRRFGRN